MEWIDYELQLILAYTKECDLLLKERWIKRLKTPHQVDNPYL